MTFKAWFEDMQERYQASYGGYEQLLQEAFEAGAKQEREACAKLMQSMRPDLGQDNPYADAIRARGEA